MCTVRVLCIRQTDTHVVDIYVCMCILYAFVYGTPLNIVPHRHTIEGINCLRRDLLLCSGYKWVYYACKQCRVVGEQSVHGIRTSYNILEQEPATRRVAELNCMPNNEFNQRARARVGIHLAQSPQALD